MEKSNDIIYLGIQDNKKQNNKKQMFLHVQNVRVKHMQIGSTPTSNPTRLQKDQAALHNQPEMRRELMKQTRLNRQ